MTEHLADESLAVANDNTLDLIPDNTTIADLPNELLEEIFMFNSLHNFQCLHNPGQTIRRTSQVCRRWRTIALNTPVIWAHIVDLESRSRWIEVVLDRARSVPLDLIFPSITRDLMDESWAPNMLRNSLSFEMIDLAANRAPQVWHSLWLLFDWELLEKCLRNARSFLLSGPSCNWSNFLSPLVISYLPRLKSLSLVTPDRESGFFGEGRRLTGGRPWNLRSLNLRKCNMFFDGLSLPYLEELTIHHLPEAQALSSVRWLRILENLPKLKRLELVDVTCTRLWNSQRDDENYSELRQVVQLPNLQSLRLLSPLSHCTSILENLVIPPSCTLDLSTYGFLSLRQEFYSLVNIIEQKFNTLEDATFGDTIRLSISPNTFVAHVFRDKDSYESTGFSFYLYMAWITAFDSDGVCINIDPFTVLSVMTAALIKPCASVTKLHIDLDVSDQPEERMRVLAEIFSHFTNLKHLHHVTPSTLRFLHNFLSQRTRMAVEDDSESEAEYSKFLPLMNTISFQDVNFASLDPSIPNFFKTLHDFVTSRLADQNVNPITCLIFESCRGMSKKEINEFANVGVQLNLDES